MIRINLLPIKAAKRREQGQKQLLAGIVLVSATLVGIIIFHGTQMAAIRAAQISVPRADLIPVVPTPVRPAEGRSAPPGWCLWNSASRVAETPFRIRRCHR